MRVKRTTYAPMIRNDDVLNLNQEIKQIIQNLKEENRKKDKLVASIQN